MVLVSLNKEVRRAVAPMKGENQECPGGTQRRSESTRFGDCRNVVASGRECQEHEQMALEIDAKYTSSSSLTAQQEPRGRIGQFSETEAQRLSLVSVAKKCRGQNPDPHFRTPSRVLFSSYFLDSKAG